MHTLLKYDPPTRASEQICEDNKKKDSVKATFCPASEAMVPVTACTAIQACQISIDDTVEETLRKIFKPINFEEMGIQWVKRVSKKQATWIELKHLDQDIQRLLASRCARKTPLCVIREDVMDDLSKELLRQLIIECPERGILFKRVLDHFDTEFVGYHTLLRFTDGFIGRKRVAWQHIYADKMKQINDLETTKRCLELQVSELKQKAEQLEKKNQEAKAKRDAVRNEEIKFYKRRGEQLKAQMDVSVLPNR